MNPIYIIRDESKLAVMFNQAYEMARKGLKGGAVVLRLGRENRTNEQNAKMWAMFSELSAQVVYCGKKRTPEQWKIICYQAWKESDDEETASEIVPSFSGFGIISLETSTRNLNKKQFANLIETIYMIGAHYNVKFNEVTE